MRRLASAAGLTVALGLGACGGVAPWGDGSTVAGGAAGGAPLVCGEASFDEGELAAMLPSLATLSDEVRGAVDDLGEPAVDTSLDWRVVTADDEEVVLIRELDPDDPAAGQGETHGTARLAPITGAPNIPDGTWFVWGGSSCSPRHAESADGQAHLRLADIPEGDGTEVTLLVKERRCASGRSADGRIDLEGVTLTESEVGVRVSVRRPPGDGQTCPDNPWTQFTIDVGEPVGDRTVVDAYLVPARALPVGAEERR